MFTVSDKILQDLHTKLGIISNVALGQLTEPGSGSVINHQVTSHTTQFINIQWSL